MLVKRVWIETGEFAIESLLSNINCKAQKPSSLLQDNLSTKQFSFQLFQSRIAMEIETKTGNLGKFS